MSNEEHTEELLFISHKLGLYNQVLEKVDSLIKENKKLSFNEAIIKVFHDMNIAVNDVVSVN